MSTKRVRKPAPKRPAAPKKEKKPPTLRGRLEQIKGMKAQAEAQMRQHQANMHGFEGQILLLERMIEEEDAKKTV
jgi:hypothetical protein